MLLLIDNYDSFTHNLARYFTELGQDVVVKRNDTITIDEIAQLEPDYIVLSPGPCTPNEAGISLSVVQHFAGKIPMLGVCLGHQTIAQHFGGSIVRAAQIIHGKTSSVHHDGGVLFKDVSNPFTATRYHSLVVSPDSIPSELTVTAWVSDQLGNREIMAFENRKNRLFGVQFHPESLLTDFGHKILDNFLNYDRIQ